MPGKERYRLNELETRATDTETQEWSITPDEVIAQVQEWTNRAAVLTAAIAVANTREIDVPFLSESDL